MHNPVVEALETTENIMHASGDARELECLRKPQTPMVNTKPHNTAFQMPCRTANQQKHWYANPLLLI